MIHKMLFVAALAATSLLAGGFAIELGNPEANSDAKAKNSLVVIRAVGCHDPAKAKYNVTAEGKVDGKRQSIPLNLVALSQPGVYAVKGDVPSNGKWLLVVNGEIPGFASSTALAPISAKGVERTGVKNFYAEKSMPAQIERALE